MCFYSTIILAFGPYINVSNWTFIIIAIVITPIAFYINHHFYNKDANTRIKGEGQKYNSAKLYSLSHRQGWLGLKEAI